jgi:hypothetical protein
LRDHSAGFFLHNCHASRSRDLASHEFAARVALLARQTSFICLSSLQQSLKALVRSTHATYVAVGAWGYIQQLN